MTIPFMGWGWGVLIAYCESNVSNELDYSTIVVIRL